MTGTAPLIQVRRLARAYGEGGGIHPVLRDASLDIAAGEQLALIGRSGSGKSTLLNLLAGIDRPDAGSIRIDGVALEALDETARTRFRRRHIGFVYQFFNLIPTLTATENAALPLELNGWKRREALARARHDLDTLGLAGRADAFPDQLSGGERQRVAIARALVHAPRLVLADEPTGNLDVEIGRGVLAQLQSLCRQRGATLVTVTHSAEVAGAADRVLTLADGQLTETREVRAW
ncbi:MAG: ABC transporter ATP-binding protein [Gammaproteobacteria bacterium]|nr:ABC transporter ATP-binding protein [Gammaproteobacteria bacterium]MDX5375581.1 ABC transporter ATP-binding protein [Gammaproteobacteria bacterium]